MWICIYQRAGLQNHRLKSLFCQLKIQRTQQPDSSQEARCHRTRETKSRVSVWGQRLENLEGFLLPDQNEMFKKKKRERPVFNHLCLSCVSCCCDRKYPDKKSSREKGLMWIAAIIRVGRSRWRKLQAASHITFTIEQRAMNACMHASVELAFSFSFSPRFSPWNDASHIQGVCSHLNEPS